jgi:malate dehydrogenase (oxaloacetate-decarboxylating)
MDSRGVLVSNRDGLDSYKQELAWTPELAVELSLSESDMKDLTKVVAAYGCDVLVGASGQGGSFSESVVVAMIANSDTPVILPMSNPTAISEAIPEDLLRWSNGRALVATGSPFEAVTVNSEQRRISQANNVFVFPGIGLGTIVAGASRITDGMINASSRALAAALTGGEISERCLMPEVSRLWEVCGEVALAVARKAIDDGVAKDCDEAELNQRIADYRWRPHYPKIIVEA